MKLDVGEIDSIQSSRKRGTVFVLELYLVRSLLLANVSGKFTPILEKNRALHVILGSKISRILEN